MLRTLAIALLAIVATIASSAEAFAETKKSGTRSQAAQASKSRVPIVRSGAITPSAKSRRPVARSGAMRKATPPRGRVAPRVKTRSATVRNAVPRRGRIVARPQARPAVRKASIARGRVASRPAARTSSSRSKWGVGRYAPPVRTVMPPPGGAINERGARTLSFFHLHTRQSITVTYKRNGAYVPGALARLNSFLRDSRTGTGVSMDPRLFDILWLVRRRLNSTAAYHVVSAYRSPSTNAWLASFSSGVASNSRHMHGQAMDVILPGRSAAQVRAAGLQLGMGGVGYYPRTGFVHLDTGPVRRW